MIDIQVRVHRPVALPEQFFGAPVIPAVITDGAWMLVFFAMILFYFPFPPLGVILLVANHVAFMMWGAREPHMSTLVQTMRRNMWTPRNMGRRSRQHTFLP